MREAFVLPDIGEGIVECEIVQWHVQAGDTVSEDQVVVEVMTDKAIVEIPAKHDGIIVSLLYKKGDIAKVHTPLFEQEIAPGEHAPTDSNTQQQSTQQQNCVVVKACEEINKPTQDLKHSRCEQGENFEAPLDVGRAIASPAVRRLAKEQGIVLNEITASGKKGRVLKQDVLSACESSKYAGNKNLVGENTEPSKNSHNNANTQVDTHDQARTQDTVEPVKGIKAVMAKQMMASVSSIPHFSVSDELCMDKLISLRTSLKAEFESLGVKLSYLPFFIKALSLAIQKYPILNSRLNDQANELTYVHAHNIGIAVDGKLGLMVPNIKNVQALSLFEVAKELARLIEAARDGKLSSNDLKDGTISISNIGAIGGITATPVINKPNVAIVALGKTQILPRFNRKGKVKAKNIMSINWSGDHRVIDGATMVKFNNLWMDYLAKPESMLMHLR